MIEIVKELEGNTREIRRCVIKNYLLKETDHFEHRYVIEHPKRDEVMRGINLIVPSKRNIEIGISCHYDAVDKSPGADDNASAVAVTLDLISRLKDVKLKNIGVRYFFFDQEEDAMTGSHAYVKQIGIKNLAALYNMEMVGLGEMLALWRIYHGGGPFTHFLQDEADKLGIAYQPVSIVIGNGADHQSFRSLMGEDAFTITTVFKEDFAAYQRFLQKTKGLPYKQQREVWEKMFSQSPKLQHYHQPTDKAENLNPKTLEMVSNLLYNTILALGHAQPNQ